MSAPGGGASVPAGSPKLLRYGMALLVPAAAAAIVGMFWLGPLARRMAEHIVLMNLVAPALAFAFLSIGAARTRVIACARSAPLAAATASQLIVLWAWHVPSVMEAASRPATHLLMQASLATVALWFWLEILSDGGVRRWRALLALLLTGKLFCLLGVLLVFAPRLLYPADAVAHGQPLPDFAGALADQHLAGLLMLLACPLTYVAAGVVIAALWLRDLMNADARRRAAFSSPLPNA